MYFTLKRPNSEFDLRETFNLFSQSIQTIKNCPVFFTAHQV